MMRRLQEEKQRHAATCEILKGTALCFNCANRMMEERSLLILGQQEHEQLLDEEISQQLACPSSFSSSSRTITSILALTWIL
jgi:hypothetical protein